MKSKSLAESFRHAFDGFVHVLRTQRHMRYHLVIITLVLLLCLAARVSRTEWVLVLFVIGLVLTTELVNTAVEVVVDLVTESYHPLAKIAKDVAGAAVLVASSLAVLVGGVIFLDPNRIHRIISPIRGRPDVLLGIMIGLALTMIVVVIGKLRGGKGTLLRGGVISGHAALAFFLFGAICFLTSTPLVWALALALALLVAQSRLQAGIHTLQEVLVAALAALLISLLIFRFWT